MVYSESDPSTEIHFSDESSLLTAISVCILFGNSFISPRVSPKSGLSKDLDLRTRRCRD